jgi:uncharacterized protein (TIGR01244 family)
MTTSQRFILFAVACLLTACATTSPPDWPDFADTHQPQANRLVMGQPTPAQLVQARDAGAQHVINARGEGEMDAWNEAQLVRSLGMQYHALPIANTNALDREAVNRFDALLAQIGDQPAVLHCGSGNRIGALYALRAAWLQGASIEEAIGIGKTHGLTSLEPVVREKLR